MMELVTHSANLLTLFQPQSLLSFVEVMGIYCECCKIQSGCLQMQAMYISTLPDLWCSDVIPESWSL